MLVVRTKPAAADWTPVMGGEVLFDPIDRPMLIRARRAARETRQAEGEDQADTDAVDPLDLVELLGAAFSHALIMEGARDWRSVGAQRFDEAGEPVLDADGAEIFDPLEFSKDTLALALTDPIVFEAFDAAYVVPFVTRERQRAEPGNGSAASPTGTGEAATPDSDTATSVAKPVIEDGATPAPTSNMKPKRKPRKSSGAH